MRKILLTCLAAWSLSGCVFVPIIDAMHESGATESDRKQLLPEQVQRFSNALTWSNKAEAMEYVDPSAQAAIATELESYGEDLKIVDSRVSGVKFDSGAWKATVNISLRYYEVPYYVVKTRKDSQEWSFGMNSGWRLTSMARGNPTS